MVGWGEAKCKINSTQCNAKDTVSRLTNLELCRNIKIFRNLERGSTTQTIDTSFIDAKSQVISNRY